MTRWQVGRSLISLFCPSRNSTGSRELREAHRLYTEMGAVGHAERVGRELGL